MSRKMQARMLQLLPQAIEWAEMQSALARNTGLALRPVDLQIASSAGVQRPEEVRLCFVERLPLPDDLELRQAALETGALGSGAVAMTLGYGMFMRYGYKSDAAMAHELTHVAQFEKAGSLARFVQAYVEQVLSFGHRDAPLEIDARHHGAAG